MGPAEDELLQMIGKVELLNTLEGHSSHVRHPL
jgi:hypothetical protein